MVGIFVLALAIRVVYGTRIHPPHDHVFSDMGGYFDRTDDFVTQPLTAARDYLSFYPWGTHAYLGVVKALFVTGTCSRKDFSGCAPLDLAMAFAGAIAVLYATLLARRIASPRGAAALGRRRRWFHVVLGVVAACYFPLIAQGGYFLSEVPLAACLCASAYHTQVAFEEGRGRAFFWAGLWAGLGAIVRPQILMSVLFVGLFFVTIRALKKPGFPRATFRKALWGGLPLMAILAFSAIRTTRHYRRFERDGFALVSTNDALNYAFGRCHSISIESFTKDGGRSGFGPPSLGALHFGMGKFKEKNGWAPIELLPAMPPDLKCEANKRHAEKKEPPEPCIRFEGRMWSRKTLRGVADRCVAATGLARQAYYAATHVLLNFGFNHQWPNAWPEKLKKRWQPLTEWWQILFGAIVWPFAIVASCLAWFRRFRRYALLATHLFALAAVSMIYFGETRLRLPYDLLFIVLGFDLWATLGRAARRWMTRLLAR